MNAKKSSTAFFRAACILFLFAASASAQNYGEWSALLGKNDAWFASDAQAITVGDQIVSYQLSDGGWRKGQEVTSGEWAKSTVDNDATTSQITFLARLYKARNTAKYLTSLNKGIDLFLNGQYSNGGFPQIFSASTSTYHAHITFNDGAMVRIMDILLDVSLKRNHFTFIDNDRSAKAKTAVEHGVDMILNSQITSNNLKTAWCQQHDKSTLAPASARAYELPSISGSESVGIVDFLKRYDTSLGSNRRADVVQAINAAVTWMTSVRIVGYKVENITTNGEADRHLVASSNSDTLWARFYEIGTNRPMFVGRDGVKKYSMAEIEQERRAGYAWYGTWPRGLVRAGTMAVPITPSSSSVVPSSSSAGPVYRGTGNAFDSLMVFDAANAAAWAVKQDFGIGAKIFGDRDFITSLIPADLAGTEWISTSMVSRTFIGSTIAQFKMRRTATVYLMHEDRVTTKPSWMASAGFTVVNQAAVNQKLTVTGDAEPRTFTVYSKNFNQGEIVRLGPNSSDGTSTSMMYLIAFSDDSVTPMLGNAPILTHFSVQMLNGKTMLVEASSPTVLDIFDLTGKKVASYNVQGATQTLHLNLQNGVYFAAPRGMQAFKFVVK
ncbi:MAG: pectate lyase [Fibromonadales bacterium]|nr:pectate lyase [Fibromonadales bacterium]